MITAGISILQALCNRFHVLVQQRWHWNVNGLLIIVFMPLDRLVLGVGLVGLDPFWWTFPMRAEARENVRDDSASETLV
jgi:hypothetical protein